MPRALLALLLALSCAASVGAGGGWDERGYGPPDDHPVLEFGRSFLGRSESLRALRTVDASATTSLAKGSMVTSCDELGGVGNLSSTESPCVVPANASVSLPPGTWILGSGSLTLSPQSYVGCDAPGCLITVLLGGTLRVNHRARVHGGYVNVTAAAVEIIGLGASVDADGLADPDERRGWNTAGGGWNRPAKTTATAMPTRARGSGAKARRARRPDARFPPAQAARATRTPNSSSTPSPRGRRRPRREHPRGTQLAAAAAEAARGAAGGFGHAVASLRRRRRRLVARRVAAGCVVAKPASCVVAKPASCVVAKPASCVFAIVGRTR